MKFDSLPEPGPGERLPAPTFATVVRSTPLVSIDLIVRSEDGLVLLGRRKNEPARGALFVPGGRITKNEARAAGFLRVTLSELGVANPESAARFVGVYDHLYPTNALELPGFGTHYVVLAYELPLPRATIETSGLPVEQHGEYLWASEAEILDHPDVHENTKAYFRKSGGR